MFSFSTDDSQDLFSTYKIFLKNIKSLNLKNFQRSLSRWFNISGVKVEPLGSKSFPCVRQDEFDIILTKVAELKLKSKEITQSSNQPNTSSIDNVVTLIDEDTQPANEPMGSNSKPVQDASGETANKTIIEYRFPVIDLEPLASAASRLVHTSVKAYVAELHKVLELMTKQPDEETVPAGYPLDSGDGFQHIRIIPKDKTYEANKITHIEGILPVKSSGYRQAFKAKTKAGKSYEELEPSMLLNNIIRNCFPKHWLKNTTIRGAGGKKGLVTIWNYENPLSDPCTGAFKNGLGQKRLMAIIGKFLPDLFLCGYFFNIYFSLY